MSEQESRPINRGELREFLKAASATSEQTLEVMIDHVDREYRSRLATLMAPPGDDGYSSQVLTSCAALLGEFDGQLATFAMAARRFGETSAVSLRLSALSVEVRRALKEARYMAPFKAVREEFVAYVAALPGALPPNAPAHALADSLNRFSEFQQRFNSFEPRARELEAEGQPTFCKWLTPAIEAAQIHIAAVGKRSNDLIRAELLEARENRYLADLNEIYRRYLSLQPGLSLIGDLRCIDMAMAGFEAAAQELDAKQRPALRQRLTEMRAKVQKTIDSVQGIVQQNQAAHNVELGKIAAQSRKDTLDAMDRMHQIQLSMNVEPPK